MLRLLKRPQPKDRTDQEAEERCVSHSWSTLERRPDRIREEPDTSQDSQAKGREDRQRRAEVGHDRPRPHRSDDHLIEAAEDQDIRAADPGQNHAGGTHYADDEEHERVSWQRAPLRGDRQES